MSHRSQSLANFGRSILMITTLLHIFNLLPKDIDTAYSDSVSPASGDSGKTRHSFTITLYNLSSALAWALEDSADGP